MKNKYFFVILSALSCVGCTSSLTSDEPDAKEPAIAEGTWVVEYQYHTAGNVKFSTGHAEWCAKNIPNMVWAVPSNVLHTYDYNASYHVRWREYVTNPTFEELNRKLSDFESIFYKYPFQPYWEPTSRYYKYDPEYTGPWKVTYSENYYNFHIDNPDFHEWLSLAQKKRLINNYFNSPSWCGPDAVRDVYDCYKENIGGIFLWSEVIETATEAEIKEKVAKFKSFTQINSGTSYDTFEADYVPLNVSSN